MFSIYSHVRNKNRGGRQPPGYDSDQQIPTLPPTIPTLRVEPTVKPRAGHATSLPTPSSNGSQAESRTKSTLVLTQIELLPPTKQSPANASEPEEADEEEAIEATIAEELAGSQPTSGGWVLDALKKEPSRVEPTTQRNKSSPTATLSKREQIQKTHRALLLGIKRSMRGRNLGNPPIGDRSPPKFRYLSPFELDDLKDSYKKKYRSPNPIAPATPEIPLSSESFTPPPKRQRPRTPEPKKRQQRPKSATSSTSTRRQSARNASVKKTVAAKSKGTFLFQICPF
jgi:hypothetical protein